MGEGVVRTFVVGSTECVGRVLILVVVEDGLVLPTQELCRYNDRGLNPCCSGRWSRTSKQLTLNSLIKPS